MINASKKLISKEYKLYNKILTLSRNKFFYEKLYFSDTFQNRINLIFIHISFIFINFKKENNTDSYNEFFQKMFDLTFKKIEQNMREIGYSDTMVNKNMKFLVKVFYNILLNCEKYKNKSIDQKKFFLKKYIITTNRNKPYNNDLLLKYFDKYQSFCLDLHLDNVLKGELNFNYK